MSLEVILSLFFLFFLDLKGGNFKKIALFIVIVKVLEVNFTKRKMIFSLYFPFFSIFYQSEVSIFS